MINGIRNSNNHTFSISNQNLIDNEGVLVCSIADLDLVFNRITEIIGWYGTIISVSIYYYPKFFLIALFSILTEYNTKKDIYLEWYESLKIMSPKLFQENDTLQNTLEVQPTCKLSERKSTNFRINCK